MFCNLENANVYTGLGRRGVTAAAPQYKGDYFRDVGANERIDLRFLCAQSCCLSDAAEIRAHFQFFCCTFFLLMGIHAGASASPIRSMHTCTHAHVGIAVFENV